VESFFAGGRQQALLQYFLRGVLGQLEIVHASVDGRVASVAGINLIGQEQRQAPERRVLR